MKQLIFCILLTGMLPALAHELPLESLEIQSQNIQVATSFSLNEQQIGKIYHTSAMFFDYEAWFDGLLLAQNIDECASESQTKACGIIDPFTRAPKDEPFFVAGVVGIYLCNAYESLNPGQYNDGLVPQFTAPGNFISTNSGSEDHHNNYNLSEGIAFNCVFEMQAAPVLKQIR